MSPDPFTLPAGGPYSWNASGFSFAGWVPNVSGHLSFNLVDPQGGLPTYNHQPDLTCRRTVALHRERVAQDYPLPDWLMRRVRPSARQDFLLLAESTETTTPYFANGALRHVADRHGALVGVIAVLPADADRETEGRRRALLATVEHRIGEAVTDRAIGEGNPHERVALELGDLLQGAQSQMACYLLRFALFRTGELRIWFDLADFLGRDVAAEPPTVAELEMADSLPAQAYYFAKDLLHAHYHHHRHSDQLLPLTRLLNGGSEAGVAEDETAWRYATLRGLARVVLELRQGRSLQGHKRALGMIAYANAFQAVLARTARARDLDADQREDDGIILYDFANLEASISATDAAAESANGARLQFFAIEIGILLSALALWAGAVQIQPILCQSLGRQAACPQVRPGPIVSVVNLIVANPIGFSITLLVLGLVAFVGLFRRTEALPRAERAVRALARLSEAISVEVSRWTRGSDGLGLTIGAGLLASLAGALGYGAFWLAPKTKVPPVEAVVRRDEGPWSSLAGLVGRPIGSSGLLASSIVSADVRNLLGADYPDFMRLLGDANPLVRDGDVLRVVSAAGPGADGAFLLLDPARRSIEGALRRGGRLAVHRTPGPMIVRPKAVIAFLGAGQRADAAPVPVETNGCAFVQSGVGGRTLQLSGALRADEPCVFAVELQAGQSLSFDSRKAPGLGVVVLDRTHEIGLAPAFKASASKTYTLKVSWADWHPGAQAALRRRRFYARLDIH